MTQKLINGWPLLIIMALSVVSIWLTWQNQKSLDKWRTTWDANFKPLSFWEFIFLSRKK